MKKIFSLCLHRVSDEISPAYPPMPIHVFERLMKFLKKKYEFISLTDLKDNYEIKKGGILLTFDDAYYDFYENVFPILKKLEIPVILNVITSCAESGQSFWTQKLNKLVEAFYTENRSEELSKLSFCQGHDFSNLSVEKAALNIYFTLLENTDKGVAIDEMENRLGFVPKYTRMMNWEEIIEVQEQSVVIGSHSHLHENLALMEDDRLKHELRISSELIQKHLGKSTDIIAFPNGQYNEKVLDFSFQMNYNYGLTIENKSFTSDINNSCIKTIPRINVYNTTFFKTWLKLNYFLNFK